MRKQPVFVVYLLFCTACSALSVLEIPPVSNPPKDWISYSSMMFPDSQCADIGGMYLEPPNMYKDGKMLNLAPEDKAGSYYGHIPFHIAEKEKFKENENDLLKTVFLIRQPDAENFYFSFLTEKLGIVEYHFRADEGDFKCKDGYIEFPIIRSYGMIEAMSVNYQIRNVVIRDDSGALVIQETIGPYRGDPATAAKEFKYKFLRYPQYLRTQE